MDASELLCSANVEKLNSNGVVLRRTSYKSCSTILGRDQFGDILLRIVVKQQIVQNFLLKDISLHRRFVKEGKATVKLPTQNVLIMLSNCPPDKLAAFLACLKVKLAVKANNGFAGERKRLRSELPKTFDHISPLIEKDLQNMKENVIDLHDKTPKRKRSDTSGNAEVPRKRLVVMNNTGNNSTAKAPKASLKLNKSQLSVLNAVKSGVNVFITGSGGTGKSFLLKRIIGILPPRNTFVTASTGVSACQIGGMTLHSFAGKTFFLF